MERREYFEESFEPCEIDNFKSNCENEESEELEVRCTNISNARCVGILAEKIFDCVYLESLQFADKDEVFTIDNFEDNCSRYRVGDAVCIDDISLCYDNIGIKDDDSIDNDFSGRELGEGNILVKYDMENKIFSAVDGNGVEVYNNLDNFDGSEREPSTVMLYDEFEGAVGKTKCNSESRTDRNSRSRVFKQGMRFFVDNLKVRIRGRIGGRLFTATKDYNCYGNIDRCGKNNRRISVNPVEITKRDTLGNGEGCGDDVGLNFTPVNLYGRVGVPNDGRRVRGNIKLDHCLSVECVETTERYGDYEEGYIRATVGYSFLVTHNILHTTSEEIAVFTNPNGVECHNTARESDCRRRNNDDNSDSSDNCNCRRNRRNNRRCDRRINNRERNNNNNRCNDDSSSSSSSSSDNKYRNNTRDIDFYEDRNDRCNEDRSDRCNDRCNEDRNDREINNRRNDRRCNCERK